MFAKFVLAFVALIAFVAAQIPIFPDNIIVFPERDFVSLEGFNGISNGVSYAGRQLAIQVVRNGAIVGESVGTVSGGQVAFEVNHPGGYCWGEGSSIKVTPDIKPGDTMILRNPTNNLIIAQTTVLNGMITGTSIVNNVVTITGTVASGIAADAAGIWPIEARIVAPALKDTIIGRRDVRAIPGAAVTNAGYTSQMTIVGTTWTATMTFVDVNGVADPTTADIAFGGAFSVSTWMFTDADGNGQGLTISEFGEAGGPMSGNCPPYAGSLMPILPDGVAVYNGKIYWNPATDQAGTAYPFNYYNIEVIRPPTTLTPGVSTLIGAARVTKDSTSTGRSFTMTTAMAAGDTVEVRAAQIYSGVDQFTAARKKSIVAQSLTGILTPTFVGIGAGSTARTVTLSSSQGLQIAYTITSGSVATPVSLGSPSTLIYSGPIPITGTQTIQMVAFGFGLGTMSATATATVNNYYPNLVSGVSATRIANNGVNAVRVAWQALSPAPTGYKVTVIAGSTSFVLDPPVAGTVTSVDIGVPTLVRNTAYTFSVAAYNVVNAVTYTGNPSVSSNAVVFVTTDVISVTDARYKAGELRITGTGNVDGAIVTIFSGRNGAGVNLGSAAVTANVFNYRNKAPPAGLTTISVVSSMGATVNVVVA